MIIPVRDRRELLKQTLAGLDAQTFRDFEVIVVDDGSTDGSAEAAASAWVAGKRVRVLHNPGNGAVAARQHGACATTCELLAFTDSDCTPVPEWLERLVDEADGGADLVAGPTVPARAPRPLERTMGAGDEQGYPTCNVLYRRRNFEQVGGFSEDSYDELRFRPNSRAKALGFGEDSLVAWRVRRAGGVASFAPDAVVRHAVFPPDLADMVSRSWQMGGYPSLIKAIPELRGKLLGNNLFLGARCRVMVYPLIGSLALRRRGPAFACFAVWAALRMRRSLRAGASLPLALGILPIELVNDVVMSAALVGGSARARSVVL